LEEEREGGARERDGEEAGVGGSREEEEGVREEVGGTEGGGGVGIGRGRVKGVGGEDE